MKKAIILMLFVITGCSTVRNGVDMSSKCIYDVEGLSCKREQVWKLQHKYYSDHISSNTMYWFKEYETCHEYAENPDKGKELGLYYERNELTCGNPGTDHNRRAGVKTYYIYTNSETDGDFYYIIPDGIEIKHESKWFVSMFTSKSALRRFQSSHHPKLMLPAGSSLNRANRIKVKRIE